jgi:hypothetical protein
MKTALCAIVLAASVSPAIAGGLPEPTMDETVIIADTSSSGGDNWVGIMMTLLVFGSAIAGQ